MKNSRRTAYQAGEIERLRAEQKELEAELKATEIELDARDRALAQAERENKLLRENFERFMDGYSERAEALEEAKRGYEDAMTEVRALQKKLKQEAEAQIREMRRENRIIT